MSTAQAATDGGALQTYRPSLFDSKVGGSSLQQLLNSVFHTVNQSPDADLGLDDVFR